MGRKRALKLVLVAAAAIICMSLSLAAAEIHVPADYASIQDAVLAASSGDTIIVAAGQYTGVSIGNKSNLTVRGEQGATIKGRIVIYNCTNLTIEGFQITSPQEGILVMGTIKGLTIRNNDIVSCRKHGITFTETSIYSDVVIEGNTIAENGYDGIQLLGTSKKGKNENPVVVKDNKILNNGRSTDTGVGIRVGIHNSGVLIEGNEISGNSFAGVHPG